MKLDRENIFLVDGSGAVLSTVLLGAVLPAIQPVVGVPMSTLYTLAAIAACLAFYSYGCHLMAPKHDPRFLRAIALANAAYCVLSLAWVVSDWPLVTALGLGYFVGEVVIVAVLVTLEWRIADAIAER